MAKNGKKRGVASVIVAQRAPHLAVAEVVDLFGSELAQLLYKSFAELNAEHFGGDLGSPMILITQAESARTLGDYTPRDVHGLESRIRIAPHAAKRGALFALDVLLHEMVHAWQHELDEDLENGYRGHGPRFAKKCTEIGAKLGLGPVGVKGRDGLPDCKSWPMCVRPAGYYGVPYEPPTRGKKSKGESRPEEGESAEPAPESSRAKLTRIVRLFRQLNNAEMAELCDLLAQELRFRGEKSDTQPEAAE